MNDWAMDAILQTMMRTITNVTAQPVVGTIAPHLLPLIKVNSKKFPPYVIFTYR